MAFVAARLAVAPLGGLDPELRGLRGRILSLGCGFGVLERYLGEINPEVEVGGIDIDSKRVRAAAETADRAPRVNVYEQDATRLAPNAAFDAALAIDVLHHVPRDAHGDVATGLFSTLKPSGVCLLKDIATRRCSPTPAFAWRAPVQSAGSAPTRTTSCGCVATGLRPGSQASRARRGAGARGPRSAPGERG